MLKSGCFAGFWRIHVSRYVSKIIMLNTYVEAICLNYRPKKDNTFPIMLRLTKSGKRKYVSLGISVKEKDWDFKKNQPKKSCPDREAIVKLISDKVSAYNSLIMELTAKQQEFTMSSLVQMIENKIAVKTVSEMYDYLIDEFRKTDHLGTMSVYQQSKSSLTKFNRTLDIPFSDIDCQWLERYEKWLKSRNIKDTTVSILFRLYPDIREAYDRYLELVSIYNTRIAPDLPPDRKEYERARILTKLARWYDRIDKMESKCFHIVLDTFKENYLTIMNYFDNRSTNASAESFNAKVKAFRNQFRGVRDISFFIFRLAKIFA